MPIAQQAFAPKPRCVAQARQFLRATLAAWRAGEVEFPAAQALTELTTNAVIHAKTEFTVILEWDDLALRISVEDHSGRLPNRRVYAVDATTGRGLAVIDTLSRSWGCERLASGKRVWCEITGDVADIEVEPDLDELLALDDALAGELDDPVGNGAGSVNLSALAA